MEEDYKPTKDAVLVIQLYQILSEDLFYGIESAATPAIVNGLFRDNKRNEEYLSLMKRLSESPHLDEYSELICLWCGMMGLPAYQDGKMLDWRWREFLDHWEQDFEIQLADLRNFLREHEWPLPAALFPDEKDNTCRKVKADKDEAGIHFDMLAEHEKSIKKELHDLKETPPESMAARKAKKAETEKLEKQLENLYQGIYPGHKLNPPHKGKGLQTPHAIAKAEAILARWHEAKFEVESSGERVTDRVVSNKLMKLWHGDGEYSDVDGDRVYDWMKQFKETNKDWFERSPLNPP